jgi:FkbM family methyltransferase
VTSYAQRTAFALALEPDPANHAALRANVARLPAAASALIESLECAVDATSGTASFSEQANVGSMLSASGGTAVRTVSVDDLLAGRRAERIYVKMDVEGAEAGAIRGAERTIRERAPFLAVSVYHRPNDLWEVPRLIAALNDEYRFMLRSHGADGADLTAYAVPPAR